MIMYIIRGAAGSGKSSLAKVIARATMGRHLEADMYFVTNGVYQFDPALLLDAHLWCHSATEETCRIGVPVIISNTFAAEEHCQPYRNLAAQYGYLVQEIVMLSDHGSIHHVEPHVLEKQKAQLIESITYVLSNQRQ